MPVYGNGQAKISAIYGNGLPDLHHPLIEIVRRRPQPFMETVILNIIRLWKRSGEDLSRLWKRSSSTLSVYGNGHPQHYPFMETV
jgi:hypothetical protein